MSAEKRNPQREVTPDQLREGEEGLRRLLFAKRFSREWVDRHVPEVMAQARADLADRLGAEAVRDTVALLVVIAYRRALKALRTQQSRPATVSIEQVYHLPDESARTPEQEVLDSDRQARLLDAMGHLPERERKLLALVYFGEMTVKDAGRQLGWSPSSAVRHQRSALAKLQALLGERSLLGVEIGAPAFVASEYPLPKGQLGLWFDAVSSSIRELVTWATQRTGPMAEAGNAIAVSGAGSSAGRTAAGICGLTVAACLTGVAAVVGPGVPAIDIAGRPQGPQPEAVREVEPSPAPRTAVPGIGSGVGSLTDSTRSPGPAAPRASMLARKRRWDPAGPADRETSRADAEPADPSPEQTVSEFGVEGSGSEAREASVDTPPSTAPIAPAAPAFSGSGGSSSPSSGAAGSGSARSAGSEFGM